MRYKNHHISTFRNNWEILEYRAKQQKLLIANISGKFFFSDDL